MDPYKNPMDTIYQEWLARQSENHERDYSKDGGDYDIRTQFNESLGIPTPAGHGTDRYKLPNHPTFSDQSMYSSPATPGGHWSDSDVAPVPGEQQSFTPSPHMLQGKDLGALYQYFQDFEADGGYKVQMPPIDEYNLRNRSE